MESKHLRHQAETSIEDTAKRFLQRVERDSASITRLCSDLVKAPSENPPGDTTKAFAVVTERLDRWKLKYKLYEPAPGKQNLVARFDSGRKGPHLVFSGHLDVFPAGDHSRWDKPPFSGLVQNGHLFGRGAVDMKAGVTSLLYVFAALHRFSATLNGRATLTLVCDEETFGEHGARYLFANVPDISGDSVISGEPGQVVGFGERGFVWAECVFQTKGGHSAYPQLSANAIKLAAKFVEEVQRIERVRAKLPAEVVRHLAEVKDIQDQMLGAGSTEVAKTYSVNIGRITGGTKVNMNAADCRVEVDVRLPVGTKMAPIIALLRQTARKFGGQIRLMNTTPPSLSDRRKPIFDILRLNATRVLGAVPPDQISLATSDARLWRYKGVPAVKFGPRRNNTGRANEFIFTADLIDTVRVHGLTALEYLSTQRK
jgi:succinyl-diaminopimelate desuccinylase